MALTYRLFEESDLPGLKRLWEQETGWGTITDAMFRRHVLENPAGDVTVVIAADDHSGEILGQFVFSPSRVSVRGREVLAFRPAAPILSKAARVIRSPNPLHHPAAAMYHFAIQELRARGDGLIYMVPDPRWLRFFQMFPMLHGGSQPLYSVPLPLVADPDASLPLGDGFSIAPAPNWDAPRIDALWQTWSRSHHCMVVRDSGVLPWKIGRGDYEITAVERGGDLVGLAAARQKGDRQYLICDILAADLGDALRAILTAVVHRAHAASVAASSTDHPIGKAAVLATPAMEPVVRALGFVRDAYDFPIVIHLLDASLDKNDVAPAHWYVSAND